MDSGERGMNPIAMAIFNSRKEYWPSWGSNQRPPVVKSATLSTELWGSAPYFRIKLYSKFAEFLLFLTFPRRECYTMNTGMNCCFVIPDILVYELQSPTFVFYNDATIQSVEQTFSLYTMAPHVGSKAPLRMRDLQGKVGKEAQVLKIL